MSHFIQKQFIKGWLVELSLNFAVFNIESFKRCEYATRWVGSKNIFCANCTAHYFECLIVNGILCTSFWLTQYLVVSVYLVRNWRSVSPRSLVHLYIHIILWKLDNTSWAYGTFDTECLMFVGYIQSLYVADIVRHNHWKLWCFQLVRIRFWRCCEDDITMLTVHMIDTLYLIINKLKFTSHD